MPTLRTLAVLAVLACSLSARADEPRPPADVVELDATVASDVAPDLAVIALAVVREGPDPAALTRDVDAALARAFADAKAVPGVVAANGGFATQPRYDDRGNAGQIRNGWTVRGEIVLKSKNFEALGALVGRLSQTMQVVRSDFELSPELRSAEGDRLLARGAQAFGDRAAAAARAFGFAGYTIRQVTIGNAGGNVPAPRAAMFAMKAAAPAPMPLESGQVTLTLTVSGSIQLTK